MEENEKIEEKDIVLRDCNVSYKEDSAFSKFCIGNLRIEATSLPLIEKLPPIENLVSKADPEHDKKFIYKAAKVLFVVKIEKSFYGPSVGSEIQEKAIHGFIDGVELCDALEESIQPRPLMINKEDRSENYTEIKIYETKDHQLKRVWVATKAHRQNSSSDSCREVNVMIQTKDDSMFRGMIEVEDSKEFLSSIFYNESFCND